MAWAPESVYDPVSGDFLVHWSSGLAEDGDPATGETGGSRILLARTRDFRTFAEPETYLRLPGGVIDMTLLIEGTAVHRFAKQHDEAPDTMQVFQQVGSSLLADDFATVARGSGRSSARASRGRWSSGTTARSAGRSGSTSTPSAPTATAPTRAPTRPRAAGSSRRSSTCPRTPSTERSSRSPDPSTRRSTSATPPERPRMTDFSPRLADALVTVLGADGAPLAHADVTVEQRRHAFAFGCTPPSTDPARAEERRLWLDLFDTATLPVYWGRFEPERGRTATEEVLAEARALAADGVRLKGHPLVWHYVKPEWLDALPLDEAEQLLRARIRRGWAPSPG